ncbi:MAG: indole-3-glycerol phosphate synthase TrpC [Nevskiales bacterium]|nr:indole-3-glycerol phosphate synthase TrpC [Nevskiales bacterium]
MSDFLSRILDYKREEIAALRKRHSFQSLQELAAARTAPRGFQAALRERVPHGAAVIAEIKKASPSKGLIRSDFNPAWLAQDYARGGATCLSVLTDERFFLGSGEHLKQARTACPLPVLRKDFIVDELQVAEARALGADAILLIAAALSVSQLAGLAAVARELGLDVLVEIHDAAELDRMLKANLPAPVLLGINNRNLHSFEVRLDTTRELLPRIPAEYEVVTESGIATAQDLQVLRTAGVHRFLMGESLMRQPSPGAALQELLVG